MKKQHMILQIVCLFACTIAAQAHSGNVNFVKQQLAAEGGHDVVSDADDNLAGWIDRTGKGGKKSTWSRAGTALKTPNKQKGSVYGHAKAKAAPHGQPAKKHGSGFAAVILGCLLWIVCPICIWNTERISVKQAKMRLKAERYAVHIDDPQREPRDELNGHIVYITGEATCSEQLQDDVFSNVKSDGKIKLRRVVEMYQYVENKTEGGEDEDRTISYDYQEAWCDYRTEISNPNHDQNPNMNMKSTGSGMDCVTANHENVRLGSYYLSDYVIRELTNWQNKDDLTAEMLSAGWLSKKPRKGDDDWWYFSEEDTPSIGDHRVRFEELVPGPISICGVLVNNQKGWSFVPIINKGAAGTGDSLAAESGASCCFSVTEIHYPEADADADEDFLAAMETRQPEIEKHMLNKFHKADGTKIAAYNPEEDMDDLCCVGPFQEMVVRLMHWIGLEDELLAVMEEETDLHGTMKAEELAMGEKISTLRFSTFICLLFATYLIISPVMALLNYNMWVTMLGGGLLSCLICCFAMLSTCACWVGITSAAWIVYRPMMATLGLGLTIICFISSYYIFQEGEEKILSEQPGPVHAFLAMRQAFHNQGNI